VLPFAPFAVLREERELERSDEGLSQESPFIVRCSSVVSLRET
jgi:hypothetical protein